MICSPGSTARTTKATRPPITPDIAIATADGVVGGGGVGPGVVGVVVIHGSAGTIRAIAECAVGAAADTVAVVSRSDRSRFATDPAI